MSEAQPSLRAGEGPHGWALRRAWPDGTTRILELVDEHGWVRAARRHPDGLVEVAEAGADPRLAALAQVVAELGGPGRLVGHRLGRRAVIRGEGSWTKVLRSHRVTQVAARHRSTAASLVDGPIHTPQLLHLDEDRGTMVLNHLSGRPLLEGDDPVGAARTVATAFAWWRHRPVTEALDAHDASAEVAVLRHWAADADGHGVIPIGLRDRFEQSVRSAARSLEMLGPRPLVLSHRDLHDGQVLVHHGTVGVLDLDTATAADPALDLGNLLAHVDLAVTSARIDQATGTQVGAALLQGWGLEGAGDHTAVAAYRRAAQMRLVAVHGFRSDTASAARALIDLDPAAPVAAASTRQGDS